MLTNTLWTQVMLIQNSLKMRLRCNVKQT